MKYSISKTVLFACALIAATAMRAHAAEHPWPGLEGVPEVVAEVNGKPISRFELMRELVGSAGTKALERLVHRTLLEQSAAELHVTVTPEEIERQFELDKVELAERLIRTPWDKKYKELPIEDIVKAQFGMTVAEYKNIVVRQRLLARRCMARDINPSEDELRRFYETCPFFFQHPVRYRASHILITPLNPTELNTRGGRAKGEFAQLSDYANLIQKRIDLERDHKISFKDGPPEEVDAAWRQAKSKAEALAASLQAAPAKWNEAVAAYSQPLDKPQMQRQKNGPARLGPSKRALAGMLPGDVGWFSLRGPMVWEFYQGAKDLKPGQIGGPVRTEYGFHIVKMLEINRPHYVNFSDCRDKVKRMFVDNEIQLRSASWLAQLSHRADLKTEKATLWPPGTEHAGEKIGLAEPGVEPPVEDRDPVVGGINGQALKRSEVWRELLRTEGEEALRRLINREVVLVILKESGVAHMEWYCSNPAVRVKTPEPARRPIRIKEDALQRELIDDQLEYNELIGIKEYANLSFGEYIFKRYGQTDAEFRRSVEARLVLQTAIRQKVVPADKLDFEKTLKFEFALAKSQYSEGEWFEISHILKVPKGGMYKCTQEDMTQALNFAGQLYDQCRNTPDKFAELVETYSDDTAANKANFGSLGACYEDRILPNFPESQQFFNEIKKQNLEPGQFTPVLRTARGFHIVRVDRRHPARQAEFEEKRAQIERDYINERAKYYADIWVRALNSQAIVKHHYFKPTMSEEQPDVDPLPPDNFGPPAKE